MKRRGIYLDGQASYVDSLLRKTEREAGDKLIAALLKSTDGNGAKVAEILGTTRQAIHIRINNAGLKLVRRKAGRPRGPRFTVRLERMKAERNRRRARLNKDQQELVQLDQEIAELEAELNS